ncbi:hypothetical protein ABEG63_12330 [Chryseobacterium sp. C39-AII1]
MNRRVAAMIEQVINTVVLMFSLSSDSLLYFFSQETRRRLAIVK